MGKTARVIAWALVVQLGFGPLLTTAVSRAEPAPVLGGLNPGFSGALPGDFNTAGIGNQASIFSSCNGGLQHEILHGLENVGNSINGAMNDQGATGLPTGGYGIDSQCTGPTEGPSADSLSCKLTHSERRSRAEAVELAMATLQCKKGKLAAVQAELGCLSSHWSSLTAQLNSIQKSYDEYISKVQQEVSTIDGVISDRQAQNADVLSKLGGDGSPTGSKGLIGMRDGLCKVLNGAACEVDASGGGAAKGGSGETITEQVQELNKKIENAKNSETELQEAISQRTMGIAAECFSRRPVSGFQCVVNGPPVSAKDYLLCLYKQRLGVSKSGTVRNGANDEGSIAGKQNNSDAQRLENVINQMIGSTPQKLEAPKAGEAPMDASSIQAPMILTTADVESRYGQELSSFDASGMPIHDFVMKNMGFCFQSAERTVNKEKSMVSSGLGRQQIKLKQDREDLRVEANRMISAHASNYEQAMTALTGMHLPLNTQQCKNAAPDVQVACLKDIENNMQSLLSGSGANSTIKMAVNGSNPALNIVFTCQGLNGCITALRQVDKNLKTEIKRASDFKKSYVMAAHQQIKYQTSAFAGAMNGVGGQLNSKLNAINAALGSLGGSSVPIKELDCSGPDSQVKSDANDVPQMVPKAATLVGCAMNPKMLDLKSADFNTSSMGEVSSKIAEQTKPLQETRNAIAALNNKCDAEKMDKLAEKISSGVDQFETGNCQYYDRYCGPENDDKLSALANSLSGVDGVDSAELGDASARLSSGIGACQRDEHVSKVKEYKDCVDARKLAGSTKSADLTEAQAKDRDTALTRSCSELAPPKVAGNCGSIATNLSRDIGKLKSIGGDGAYSGSAE